MSNPPWPPGRYDARHQESNPRDEAAAAYGGSQWSPRDEMDEEELRIRLEMIKLQKKRFDAASPGGRSPHETGTIAYHQHATSQQSPDLRHDVHAGYQSPVTYASYDHSRSSSHNYVWPPASASHARAATSSGQPAPAPSFTNPHAQPEASIGGRLAGWWTQISGAGRDDHLHRTVSGPLPDLMYADHPPHGLGVAPQPLYQHAQHGQPPQRVRAVPPAADPGQLYANTEIPGQPPAQASHQQYYDQLASPVGLDLSEPFRPFAGTTPPASQQVSLNDAQFASSSRSPQSGGYDVPQRTPSHQRIPSDTTPALSALQHHSNAPGGAQGRTRTPSTAALVQKPATPGIVIDTPQPVPEIRFPTAEPGQPALQEDHQIAQKHDSPPSGTVDGPQAGLGSVANKEDDSASETGVSTTIFTSDQASTDFHTRSTSIASTDEIQRTPADKKRIILPLPSDKPDSVTDSDSEHAFDEDERCNCGRRHPSEGNCYFCWPCNGTIFCEKCWDKCPPHKIGRGRAAKVGVPHEKSDPFVAKRIFETLQSDRDEEQQALLHDRDEDSSWFGTGKDGDTGDTVFRDFGRYSRLVEELSSRRRLTRFPALVSFVGQTGAGKSSLIRLLIETLAPLNAAPEVPVVGSSLHTDLPTSGDVHLYPDLSTFESLHPVFYADCEGLDGGERKPMGARKPKANTSNPRTHSFTQHIRKQHHTSEREILWATTAETTSREYHVRHLYPRLLFTFSDVIVFVMKNPRTIENVIEQLIDWAAAALETSSNQPVLPHAIIVLNAYDNTSDPALWDVNNSTVDLLEKVSRAVHQNHKLRKFAEFWREKGRQVETVETLLLSYYSSVRVVRVPEKGRPTLIHQQVQRLYDEITEACQKSRESKHQLRMLLNSDELQPYLQHAFDHFCRNLERPFDFVQASLAFHPIPSDFGGNILKMALNIMEVWQNRLDGPSLVKELSFLVASCIMLDSARRRNLGTSEKVFGGYVHHCDEVLDTFCNLHWPCEYVHPNTSGRCVNVKAGHQSKGHQLENGRVMAVGDYQSDFTADKYRTFFEYSVAFNLRCLLQRLPDTPGTTGVYQGELSKAAEIHKSVVLGPFFRHLSGAKHFVNHTACYCCLTCPPEHPLPCGHVLCTPCVQAFGRARGAFIIEMTECPMHHDDIEGQFRIRWPVFVKPTGAGVRILALDGGGIRGIVELTILQHVEAHLGVGLPIQAFFDLIVGTSAGGIVALGLGANGWTVGKCLTVFKKLCKKAFERKWSLALPGLEHLISFSGRALYETSAIEGALKQAFGSEQALFAGTREIMDSEAGLQRTTKVAVTTTTTGGTPALLGNYNRNDTDDDAPYTFPRFEKPESEIKVFEAARATSAAPTVFKQFEHKASGQVYLDGAIHLNCPVGAALREQRLIWPENADRCPDVVLSIGTGYNTLSRKPVSQATAQPRGLFAGVRGLYKTAVDNITTSLNAEKMWREFLDHSNVPDHLRERYIRLNLKLQKDPPRMDEVSQLEEMEKKTRSQCARESDRAQIKAVADRLLATAFYFALEQEVPSLHLEAEPTNRIVTGHFQCRFAPHSAELMALGDTLRRRSRDAHRQVASEHHPYFVIGERRDGLERSSQHILEPDVVDKMIREGVFAMPRLKIKLSSRRAETEMFFCLGDAPKKVTLYPISGFPRFLVDELDSGPKVQRSSSAHIAKRAQYKLDWEDFERKRAEWTFTAAQHLSMQNPFHHFGSTDYVNPGDASLDFLDSLKDRFEGKNLGTAEFGHRPGDSPEIRRARSNIARWLRSTDNIASAGSGNKLSRRDTSAATVGSAVQKLGSVTRSTQEAPAELDSGRSSAGLSGLNMWNTSRSPMDGQAGPQELQADSVVDKVAELPGESVVRPKIPEDEQERESKMERKREQVRRDFVRGMQRLNASKKSVEQPEEETGEAEMALSNAPFEGAVVMHWLGGGEGREPEGGGGGEGTM